MKLLTKSRRKIRIFALPGDVIQDTIQSPDIEIRYGDIANAEDLKDICEGVTTVIHMAAVIIASDPSIYEKVNVGGTIHLLNESLSAGVKHFIYISSASVIYPETTPYSISKRECERLVKDSGVPWTIIRPTLVYDESGAQELNMFLAYLDRFPIVPFIGDGDALKRPVFSGDIVDGLVKTASLTQATMKIYNFSGRESISIGNFSLLCLMLMHKENKKIIHFPLWFCSILCWIFQRIMKNPPLNKSVIAGITQDANLDPAEAMEDIGFSPVSLYLKLPQCFPRKK